MANENELKIERVFDAPAEMIWEAWTNPEQLKQWWGPNNVTIPECKVDLEVGGTFSITMEAGEGMGPYKGTLWPMEATYTAVEPHTKLAYTAKAWTEGSKEETTIDQTTNITFSEDDGKTTVTIIAAIQKAGPGAQMAIQGMEAGFTQQLKKLSDFLAAKK